MVESWWYLLFVMFVLLNNESGNVIYLVYYCEFRVAFFLFCGFGLCIDCDNGFWIDLVGIMYCFGEYRMYLFVWKVWIEWVKCFDVRGLLENFICLLLFVIFKDFEF